MKKNDRTNERQPAAASEALALDDDALEDVAGGLSAEQRAKFNQLRGTSEPQVYYVNGQKHYQR